MRYVAVMSGIPLIATDHEPSAEDVAKKHMAAVWTSPDEYEDAEKTLELLYFYLSITDITPGASCTISLDKDGSVLFLSREADEEGVVSFKLGPDWYEQRIRITAVGRNEVYSFNARNGVHSV